jgi:hypothetical protein
MPEQHTILGGKVHVYKRQLAAFGSAQAISQAKIGGPARRKRASPRPRKSPRTGTYSFAELRAGEIKGEKTFREVSEHYLREYDIITQGQRNKRYGDGQHWRSKVHLVPFFGNLGISEITAGEIQEDPRRSTNTEFIGTKKQLRNAVSHRATAPRIRKSSRCARP